MILLEEGSGSREILSGLWYVIDGGLASLRAKNLLRRNIPIVYSGVMLPGMSRDL